jgi:hypothetical protein
MSEERKKRFYPKRGDYVVDDYTIPYKPAPKGRTKIDDSVWVAEAIGGINCGTYKNANQAALSIAKRIGGPYFRANKDRIAKKTRVQLRSHPS